MNASKWIAALCLAVVLLGPAAAARAQEGAAPPKDCASCHGANGDKAKGIPPVEMLAGSIHSALECSACHESISMEKIDLESPRPHGDAVQPVNCGTCHEAAAKSYVKHGRLETGRDPDLPSCASCHGTHDILSTVDPRSSVHPIHLPETCRACHANVDLVKRHEYLRDKPIALYESSVHGKASKKGLYVAATCNDCHSAADADGKRTAHRVLDAGDPQSPIHHFNIPDTCGRCHQPVTKDYWEGIHGQFVKRGRVDSPVCTHCHGEHGIIKPTDPNSPVSAARVAEATCAPCHESERLNEKYGVPAGRLRTYVDSYHGLKNKAGDVHVANCASCHGAHRILPHTDPTSSISPRNLQKTCGECHPGISTELAQTSIHGTATGIKLGWPNLFRIFYLWMISITIGLMLLHNFADWLRHLRLMRRAKYVVRLTFNETMQHWILAVSFIALVISGFSLRFSEAWWVRLLFGWGGGEGFKFRGLVHRVAAVIFIIYCAWHLLYLFSIRGRRWLRDMILSKRDFINIKENSLFFLGLRDERPRFGRFTYMEKCEYWALIWGGVLMTGTGVLLAFDDYFVERWGLPKGVLDVMLVIHYYEAWLATLAILVWHGYSTIFNPHVYPMNPAWLDGRMPKEMYEAEHPEGPKLKGWVQKVVEEEEEEEEPRSATGSDSEREALSAGRSTDT